MDFLEQIQYVIKYKKAKSNVVVDALSRRHTLFLKLSAQIIGFEHMSEVYDQDFEHFSIFASCQWKL